MIDPQLAFALAAVPAAFAVGMSKGGVPMIGILAVPILSMAMPPIAAAGLLLPVYVISDMFGVYAYRREFSVRNLVILTPAAAFGIALGWASASVVTDAEVMLAVGLIGLAFCLHRWFGRKNAEARRADVPRGIFWGTVAGFTSFMTHAGGPPFQIYAVPQRMPKMVFAGTSTLLFAMINAMKIPPYWALGQLNPTNLMITAWLAPVAVAATFIGVWVNRRLPEVLFYRLVIGALFVLSLKLVYDGIMEFVGGAF